MSKTSQASDKSALLCKLLYCCEELQQEPGRLICRGLMVKLINLSVVGNSIQYEEKEIAAPNE